MNERQTTVKDHSILSLRPPKNAVDIRRPYEYFVESERNRAGAIVDVATLFLTNRECPYHCVMCDLWKNTTDETVPIGAIPSQIDFALNRLPSAREIKLYNSGNFFDAGAIPPEDYCPIAARVAEFANVIVENHPNLCRHACRHFRDMIGGDLEVALGLETAHPKVLAQLNKHMTLADFQRAVDFLSSAGIFTRAFLLLKPPGINDNAEAIDWTLRSLEYAFDLGVQCCSVIATRSGNGVMDQLRQRQEFQPPTLAALEAVLDEATRRNWPRTFVDLWNVEAFSQCDICVTQRVERLQRMNLEQQFLPPIECVCGTR